MSPIVTTEPLQLTKPCLCWVTSILARPASERDVSDAPQQTINLCFSNIADAFRSVCRPPLGRSDHNVVHLVPKYRQLLKREKPQTRRVPIWDHDSSEALKGCFDCTDWLVFIDSCSVNPDEIADTVMSYIQFCEHNVIQMKTIRIFPNNKPRITKYLTFMLNQKKLAFLQGDVASVRNLNKEFRSKVKMAKLQYKNKVEHKLLSGNASDAWKGLITMMGRKQQQKATGV